MVQNKTWSQFWVLSTRATCCLGDTPHSPIRLGFSCPMSCVDIREHPGPRLQTQGPACLLGLREEPARPPPACDTAPGAVKTWLRTSDPAGWSPTGCVAEFSPPDPSRQRIPGSPAPPPMAQPVSESASDSRYADQAPSPPLPPSRPQQPRPWLGPGLSLLRPPPPPGTAPRPSLQPGGGGGPGAPGPARPQPFPEARRPAPLGPPWVSVSSGQREGPPRAEGPGAGAKAVIAPGPAGGPANILAAALGRGVPAAAPSSGPRLGPPGACGCSTLRASRQSLRPGLYPHEDSGVGPRPAG